MVGVQYLVFGVRSWRSAIPSDDGCIQAIHNTTFSPFITTHPDDDIAFLWPWVYWLTRRKHEEYELRCNTLLWLWSVIWDWHCFEYLFFVLCWVESYTWLLLWYTSDFGMICEINICCVVHICSVLCGKINLASHMIHFWLRNVM